MPLDCLELSWDKRYHGMTAFRRAHRCGKLRWEAKSAFWKAFPCFHRLLSRLYEMTCYVPVGAAWLDPRATVRYIGHSTKRAVPAEYRITDDDGKVVRFAFRDYAQGGPTSYKTLPVLASIGRLIRPMPDKHCKMVRCAGLSAPRWQAGYLAAAHAALPRENKAATKSAAESEPAQASLLPWRRRRLVHGAADPLLCPCCHVAMQRIEVAFGDLRSGKPPRKGCH